MRTDWLGDRLGVVVAYVLERRIAILEARSRKDPEQIRVGKLASEATLLTRTARPRIRTGAEQGLSEPQSETLLTHSTGTVKQHARGERAAPNRGDQLLAQSFVAKYFDKRHAFELESASK